MSQFLEIRSTSDSDGDGSLSFIPPPDFSCDFERREEAGKETPAIFSWGGFDKNGFKLLIG